MVLQKRKNVRKLLFSLIFLIRAPQDIDNLSRSFTFLSMLFLEEWYQYKNHLDLLSKKEDGLFNSKYIMTLHALNCSLA